MLEYQTAVVRRDFEFANEILPNIPQDKYNDVARFLESQGFKEQALQVSQDPDQKFDLALQLSKLEVAQSIMNEHFASDDSTDTHHKWKQLADLALADSNMTLAEDAAKSAGDLSGLLLMYSSAGNSKGVAELAEASSKEGKNNIAFLAFLLVGKVEEALELLIKTGRLPEAAFFARTYLPSEVSRVVDLWREDLSVVSKRAAESLADPQQYANLFPDMATAVAAQKMLAKDRAATIPAADFAAHIAKLDVNMLEKMRELGGDTSAPEEEEDAGDEPAADEEEFDDADDAGDAEEEAAAEAAAAETAAAEAAAAKAAAEAEAKAAAEAEAKAAAEAEAAAIAEAEAAAAEAKAKAAAEAEAKAAAEAEAKAAAEAEAAEAAAAAEAEAEKGDDLDDDDLDIDDWGDADM